MKIKVEYVESKFVYKMERLDNGTIMNLGGRSLPF